MLKIKLNCIEPEARANTDHISTTLPSDMKIKKDKKLPEKDFSLK